MLGRVGRGAGEAISRLNSYRRAAGAAEPLARGDLRPALETARCQPSPTVLAELHRIAVLGAAARTLHHCLGGAKARPSEWNRQASLHSGSRRLYPAHAEPFELPRREVPQGAMGLHRIVVLTLEPHAPTCHANREGRWIQNIPRSELSFDSARSSRTLSARSSKVRNVEQRNRCRQQDLGISRSRACGFTR
jgi:hypothetical protein